MEEKKESLETKVELFQYKSTIDGLDENELVKFLDERFSDMSTATIRQNKEKERDGYDRQFTALSIRDQYGNLKVNLPMEQNLIDTYEGRNAGKLVFDIVPDGKQADIDELQPAQYATEFYLEGGDNKGSGFYDIAPRIRRSKANYGTAFSFIGLDNNKQLKYKIKEGAKISSIGDLQNKDNYEPYIMDAWEFFPKDLEIRSVYVDEKSLNQPDIQKAEDAFIEKMISLDKINFTWKDNDGYKNVDKLSESTQNDDNKNNKDYYPKNQVLIRFYYNNLSKDYIIYAPDNGVIIHQSKMLYNHGKLPIESVQHYNDDNCLYGIGICQKIKYLKGFKSEIMQSILDNAAMSAGLNFIIGNSGEIEDWSLGGNGVNLWRTSVGAEEIKQMQPQINAGLVNILNILDDLVVQDTGENVRAVVDMQTDKVGIVEMMEENKAIRHKSVDSNWNLFLDRVLTMMLSNIAQFVPSLLCKTTTIKQGKKEITKVEYPYIRIKDATIEKKGGKIIINKEDNYGKMGYFELKPGTLSEGLGVKIVTPSSTSTMPLIKKDAITKWIDNKLKMAQIAALDQSGEMMSKLRNNINFQELNDWMNDVYGFEDKLKSKTGKDKIKDLNMRKVEKIRAMLEGGPNIQGEGVLPDNNQQDVGQDTGVPMNNESLQAGNDSPIMEAEGGQAEGEIV